MGATRLFASAGYAHQLTVPPLYSAGPSTMTLSSAYVYGTSGAALGWSFIPVASGTLTDVWVAIDSFTGTWGSTDGKITIEIRNRDTSANYKAGATLHATAELTLAGTETNSHVKLGGFSLSVTAGTEYMIVVGDPDGGVTNYVSLEIRAWTANYAVSNMGQGQTTTNGWTAGSNSGYPVPFAVKVGSRMYGCVMVSSAAATTNNQMRRGMRFTPSEQVVLLGVTLGSGVIQTVSGWKLQVNASASGPGASLLLDGALTVPSRLQAPNVMTFDPTNLLVLEPGTEYNIVIYPSTANTTLIQKRTLHAGMDADLRLLLAGFDGCEANWIEESGGAWVEDLDTVPQFSIVIAPPTPSGGSASVFGR